MLGHRQFVFRAIKGILQVYKDLNVLKVKIFEIFNFHTCIYSGSCAWKKL